GKHIAGQQVIDGGPSVLSDAVLVLVTKEQAKQLAEIPEAKDFVSDAYAHMKFIGHTDEASALIKAAGLNDKIDAGWVDLDKTSANDFIETLRDLRYWSR
ncbi:MAG: catalase HPII, partial [Paraglaciecola chathamensis]